MVSATRNVAVPPLEIFEAGLDGNREYIHAIGGNLQEWTR